MYFRNMTPKILQSNLLFKTNSNVSNYVAFNYFKRKETNSAVIKNQEYFLHETTNKRNSYNSSKVARERNN